MYLIRLRRIDNLRRYHTNEEHIHNINFDQYDVML